MKVYGAFFSGTGTTERVVTFLGKFLAENLSCDFVLNDFSLNRKEPLKFEEEALVILGVPVIAGRVPNVLLKYLNAIEGNGAFGVPIVLFGNRNFDDALIELRDIMEEGNIKTFAAGAFVGEHSFSDTLAKGRPDEKDMELLKSFGEKIADKVKSKKIKSPVEVDGIPYPYRGYYKPKDRNKVHIDIRKVKPLTGSNCNDCKVCVKNCPMIEEKICIKCCRCVKNCPQKAKYFADEGFLYHKKELEEVYCDRKEPFVFI